MSRAMYINIIKQSWHRVESFSLDFHAIYEVANFNIEANGNSMSERPVSDRGRADRGTYELERVLPSQWSG